MAIKFRDLTADEIEVRVAQANEKGCSLLLFKDARADMRLLDETVGAENWDCSYQEIGGKLFCTVGINCGEGTFSNWVYKQDVGTPSNMEASKGEASDAFKRACFKWGSGRELYTAPFIWVPADKLKRLQSRGNGKYACYDRFKVKRIKTVKGTIKELSIVNEDGVMVWGNPFTEAKAEKQEKAASRFAKVSELKKEALSAGIKEAGIKSWLDNRYGKPMKDFTDAEIAETEAYLQGIINDARKLDNA